MKMLMVRNCAWSWSQCWCWCYFDDGNNIDDLNMATSWHLEPSFHSSQSWWGELVKNYKSKTKNHDEWKYFDNLVNADEDIMLMLLVIMLSFYFCEICGNFPQTVTNHTCPLCTGTQWSTISATRIIRCQVSFINFPTHTPILTSPSFKCWGGGSGGSPESEAAELHEARVGAPVQVLHLLAGLLIICGWFGIGKGELNRKYL